MGDSRAEDRKEYDHYLVLSDEPLLVGNLINDIKKRLKIDESFDFDSCSIQEYEYPQIINKIFTAPFVSPKRMMVLRNIEKKTIEELKEFATMLGRVPDSCCLVMVYLNDKKYTSKQLAENFKKICKIFPQAHVVELLPDSNTIYRWIMKKMENLGLKDRHEIANYLVEEFSDDISGLKNELQKIENYLYQARQLGLYELKDISHGLTDYDIYSVANNFFQRRRESIVQLISLQSYLRKPVVLVDALGKVLCNYQKKFKIEKVIRQISDDLFYIDKRAKSGSDFVELLMEVFFIKNLGYTCKGVIYGK
ncbi:MAG: DNA polymerase III subunit delta [candidate division WOR-3 bacterium]